MSNPYSSTGSEAYDDSSYEHTDPSDTILQQTDDLVLPGQAPSGLSVLGPSLAFKGDLVAGEDLLIQGRVEGSIKNTAEHLTIGPEGSVKANIRARNIVIQGSVHGDLYASEVVTVEASAKVRGNIYAPRIGLHEGATFKGSIDMDMTEEKAAAKKTTKSTSKATKAATTKKPKTKSGLADEEVDKILE